MSQNLISPDPHRIHMTANPFDIPHKTTFTLYKVNEQGEVQFMIMEEDTTGEKPKQTNFAYWQAPRFQTDHVASILTQWQLEDGKRPDKVLFALREYGYKIEEPEVRAAKKGEVWQKGREDPKVVMRITPACIDLFNLNTLEHEMHDNHDQRGILIGYRLVSPSIKSYYGYKGEK